jgi:hypothetical protein
VPSLEEFSKKVSEGFKMQLLADGWSLLELTSKAMKINGKKQSKAVH